MATTFSPGGSLANVSVASSAAASHSEGLCAVWPVQTPGESTTQTSPITVPNVFIVLPSSGPGSWRVRRFSRPRVIHLAHVDHFLRTRPPKACDANHLTASTDSMFPTTCDHAHSQPCFQVATLFCVSRRTGSLFLPSS